MRFHWLLVPAGLTLLTVALIPTVVQHPQQPLLPPQPIAVNTEIAEPDTHFSATSEIDTPDPETVVEPVEQTLPSPPQPIRHVVRKGENLTQISKEIYGVADADTLKFILTQNPQIQHPNQLPSGAALILPPHPSPAGGER
jgi:nucleoid-associated protein YgaU